MDTAGGLRAGAVLVARGEFSIVIAGLGVGAGLEPELGPLAAAYVLLLAVLGPILARLGRAAARHRRPPAGAGRCPNTAFVSWPLYCLPRPTSALG